MLEPTSRQQLRQQLRAKRRGLTRQQQRKASLQLKRHISTTGLFGRHSHIAFYLPNDGEISPLPLLMLAHQQKRACYLPVLAPNNSLWFVRYRPGDPLKPNRYGIPEPANTQHRRKAWALGMVFLPLVGFDRQGGRLGMGGGFYDRCFKNSLLIPKMKQPHLVGLAHHCQEVDSLELENWDIPLSKVATDREVINSI
ncbi:5-formyltetrahydrofolate cyclo-ligase [Oceanicoccus sagamiensis]|uniref:5-formyltetrahydrofolate cyclo-ligase n=1 Tax=Oceanicoccus sagamiensis TaxID=716816 RepID=A0A1X9NR87_9GAMM|nr:5-formyltetrahydrofolate cyclo-ligase [Oceanicoccus sagamiensis]